MSNEDRIMNDREKTKFLTKIGFLLLKKMGCIEISTEIYIPPLVIKEKLKNNFHSFIDLLGIGWKYFPPSYPATGKVNKKIIIRGIEIKVSKNDLKNGFIYYGCNYNYLMVPKRMIVNLNNVQKSIGIIEVDINNFKLISHQVLNGYDLVGVKIIRKPRYRELDERINSRYKEQIGSTLTSQTKRWIIEEISNLRKEI